MFGSAARGDGDTSSDVDLLVVRPKGTPEDHPSWREQLDRLARDVLLWTGNHAGITEISVSDLDRLRSDRPAIVAELERDGVDLSGRELSGVLRPG
jgi:hypothetical protein